MASDIWLRTILIVRKETRCRHMGYSFRLTARVLLYAPSHRQDNTHLCYTSRGALAGTRNSSMGPPWRIDPMTHCTVSECSHLGAHLAPAVSAPSGYHDQHLRNGQFAYRRPSRLCRWLDATLEIKQLHGLSVFDKRVTHARERRICGITLPSKDNPDLLFTTSARQRLRHTAVIRTTPCISLELLAPTKHAKRPIKAECIHTANCFEICSVDDSRILVNTIIHNIMKIIR